ncbi:MAG: hypothetical protein AAFY84_06110 [Pseudomonadota bacterium]
MTRQEYHHDPCGTKTSEVKCVEQCNFTPKPIWLQVLIYVFNLVFRPIVAIGIGLAITKCTSEIGGLDWYYTKIAVTTVEQLKEECAKCQYPHHDHADPSQSNSALGYGASGTQTEWPPLPGADPALTHEDLKLPKPETPETVDTTTPTTTSGHCCCCCCCPDGSEEPHQPTAPSQHPETTPAPPPFVEPQDASFNDVSIVIAKNSLVKADSGRWSRCDRNGYRFRYLKDPDGRLPLKKARWDADTSQYRDLDFFDLDRLFPVSSAIDFSCTTALNQGMWKDEMSLSYSSALGGMSIIPPNPPWPAKASILTDFASLDKNNSGTVSPSEIVIGVGPAAINKYRVTPAWFDEIDDNDSNGLSREELKQWEKRHVGHEENGYLTFVSAPDVTDTRFMGVHVTFLRQFKDVLADPTPAKISIPVTSAEPGVPPPGQGRQARAPGGRIDMATDIVFKPGEAFSKAQMAAKKNQLEPRALGEKYAYVEFTVREDVNQLRIGACSFVDPGGVAFQPDFDCGRTRTVQNAGGRYRLYLDGGLLPTWVAKVDEPF